MIGTVIRRVMLAGHALAGHLDNVTDLAITNAKLAADNAELGRINQTLRDSIYNIHEQRQYWFNLWFTMGREFENAQNTLIDEINTLRQKLGNTQDKWEEIQKKAFHERFVDPPKHPVPGIKTEAKNITNPNEVPPEAGERHGGHQVPAQG